MKGNTQAAKLRERLREFHVQEPEECFRKTLLRGIEDPLKPRGDNGRFRPNPILVLLDAILALAAGTFLFFSVGR
jgi:hypothetical protein